jgi:hypothetical protein
MQIREGLKEADTKNGERIQGLNFHFILSPLYIFPIGGRKDSLLDIGLNQENDRWQPW